MPPDQSVIMAEQPPPAESLQPAALAGQQTLDKLTDAAHVRVVYGDPIVQGDAVVIPAAKVNTVVGFGGGGGGRGLDRGRGGGGGGWALARPIGVIVITPRGVTVKPVLDYNKLLSTALPILGVLLTLFLRTRRTPR